MLATWYESALSMPSPLLIYAQYLPGVTASLPTLHVDAYIFCCSYLRGLLFPPSVFTNSTPEVHSAGPIKIVYLLQAYYHHTIIYCMIKHHFFI
ncbi:hypothetical protein BC941DRAFT_211385 [Chlamydoabsidia padenii]|nr:hypothetical protein BC941DRAFT_211385 [Chlamydoabsidia padenii]